MMRRAHFIHDALRARYKVLYEAFAVAVLCFFFLWVGRSAFFFFFFFFFFFSSSSSSKCKNSRKIFWEGRILVGW